ncbi:hypothetical protein, partial [Bacteroides sp.]|uniref:hypothetical protein n=1 Tax=Bacteroides sp. TaxID=29523 RepID=UPI002638D683
MIVLIPGHLLAIGDTNWQFADDYGFMQVVTGLTNEQGEELEEAVDSWTYEGTNAHGDRIHFCELCDAAFHETDPREHLIKCHIDLILDTNERATVDEATGALMFVHEDSEILYILSLDGSYQTKQPDEYKWTTIRTHVITNNIRVVENMKPRFNQMIEMAARTVGYELLHIIDAEFTYELNETC